MPHHSLFACAVEKIARALIAVCDVLTKGIGIEGIEIHIDDNHVWIDDGIGRISLSDKGHRITTCISQHGMINPIAVGPSPHRARRRGTTVGVEHHRDIHRITRKIVGHIVSLPSLGSLLTPASPLGKEVEHNVLTRKLIELNLIAVLVDHRKVTSLITLPKTTAAL